MDQEENRVLEECGKVGDVKIANEVVATIAGVAALETEGVAEMVGGGKWGSKGYTKGVKVTISEEGVSADLNLIIAYGHSIPGTGSDVQDRVKTAIENMTGLNVNEVNVYVAGVQLDNQR
ncbi:MAG: Asp23/Gls24 family envelope stress response protein [Lachnospiraceae bacterium]|nr:Asp23/Gls24 family envelope stress response protein [Lachnospiraceae bacterium]MBQ9562308.1 Asp23/Gls24 family envelope stress response protein [Lachnospiraceae bacterium]MBQ9594029.1 Asp23/Gls24 family envelope stress response protein [Lachnospiraceae bacterium]MBR0153793.1 Asp23/Gls24 family envelope stress response protein [Lachnospiraceae bacterium]